jgi:hypothetical protein
MSNHTEIFAALQDAMVAYNAQPELSAELKKAKDERDFANLELEDARAEIDRLRQRNNEQIATIGSLQNDIMVDGREITDLRSRNSWLDEALGNANAAVRELTSAKTDRDLMIELLEADKTALIAKLDDGRSIITRLQDTLKRIGATIVSAVEVPEVTSDKPFQEPNTMGLSNPADTTSVLVNDVQPVEQPTPSVELATESKVEPVTEAPSSFPSYTTQPGLSKPEAPYSMPKAAWEEDYGF